MIYDLVVYHHSGDIWPVGRLWGRCFLTAQELKNVYGKPQGRKKAQNRRWRDWIGCFRTALAMFLLRRISWTSLEINKKYDACKSNLLHLIDSALDEWLGRGEDGFWVEPVSKMELQRMDTTCYFQVERSIFFKATCHLEASLLVWGWRGSPSSQLLSCKLKPPQRCLGIFSRNLMGSSWEWQLVCVFQRR